MARYRLSLAVVPPLIWVSACNGQLGSLAGQPDFVNKPRAQEQWDPGPTTPFEAMPVVGQVTKAKYLLTGLPPTQEEIDAVTASPDALGDLIDTWMTLPEFQAKMLFFFGNAFQQRQLTLAAVGDLLGVTPDGRSELTFLLLRNIQESFPRTVWELVKQGRPLNEAVTTQAYMLTPPLKAALAFADAYHYRDDQNRDAIQLSAELRNNPTILRKDAKGDPVYTVSFRPATDPQITVEEFADPKSPNFLSWSSPPVTVADTPAGQLAFCNKDRSTTRDDITTARLFVGAYGYLPDASPDTCGHDRNGRPMWTEADFDDWQMTTIKQAPPGKPSSHFYDIPNLRKPGDLTLNVPRVGFVGTLGFQTNWLSNKNNLLRGTTNQSLIVALGQSIDGEQTTVALVVDGAGDQHASPDSPCYVCHQYMEPLRQFYVSSYSVMYRDQREAAQLAVTGTFPYSDPPQTGKGLAGITDILAKSPRFGAAWAQKLCWYADAAQCAEDDPEFKRVVSVFEKSNYNWKVLVRELFSSPLVTLSRHVTTFDKQDPMVGIAQRNHFCDAVSSRLKQVDVCGLYGNPNNKAGIVVTSVLSKNQITSSSFASAVPISGFARGAVNPITPTDPSLISAAAIEKLCINIADTVVDLPANSKYQSDTDDNVNLAITDLVHNLMGLTEKDPRAAGATTLLRAHFDAALAKLDPKTKGLRTIALKSTFVVACQAPSLTAVGL